MAWVSQRRSRASQVRVQVAGARARYHPLGLSIGLLTVAQPAASLTLLTCGCLRSGRRDSNSATLT